MVTAEDLRWRGYVVLSVGHFGFVIYLVLRRLWLMAAMQVIMAAMYAATAESAYRTMRLRQQRSGTDAAAPPGE